MRGGDSSCRPRTVRRLSISPAPAVSATSAIESQPADSAVSQLISRATGAATRAAESAHAGRIQQGCRGGALVRARESRKLRPRRRAFGRRDGGSGFRSASASAVQNAFHKVARLRHTASPQRRDDDVHPLPAPQQSKRTADWMSLSIRAPQVVSTTTFTCREHLRPLRDKDRSPDSRAAQPGRHGSRRPSNSTV